MQEFTDIFYDEFQLSLGYIEKPCAVSLFHGKYKHNGIGLVSAFMRKR